MKRVSIESKLMKVLQKNVSEVNCGTCVKWDICNHKNYPKFADCMDQLIDKIKKVLK